MEKLEDSSCNSRIVTAIFNFSIINVYSQEVCQSLHFFISCVNVLSVQFLSYHFTEVVYTEVIMISILSRSHLILNFILLKLSTVLTKFPPSLSNSKNWTYKIFSGFSNSLASF